MFTAYSKDSEEPSSESFSAAVVFVNLAFSWILLNFEAMMGSIGVMIITPDTTHSAPDILPPVKNTKRKCHDFSDGSQRAKTVRLTVHEFASLSVGRLVFQSPSVSVTQPTCQSFSQ